MEENTNKAIAVNSLILYVKMGVSIICGLLITRLSLKLLGVTDFGLFSLLGGIISFIGIINTIQVSTSNRFIAVAIGRGDKAEINAQFNVNLFFHVAIAIITALFAYPIGVWYVSHFVNYDGEISNAIIVYVLTVTASIFSFIGVPYNGLLMAKEKFIVFCLVDVLSHILKLGFIALLFYFGNNKLLWYTIGIAFFSCFHVPFFYWYCKRKWPEIVKFRIVREKKSYKDVLSFSGWVAYGAIATVTKTQGAAIVINLFFTTAMNTAVGLANAINSYILQFAHNVTQPIAPQITKSFSVGDKTRTSSLLILSTKFSYLLMFLISVPFLINTEWLMSLWLGEVPPFATLFVKLMIVDGLISSFNSGLSSVIFASGNIRFYQLSVNTLRVLAVVVGYFILRAGAPPYALFIVYIIFSVLIVFVIQYVLNRIVGFDNSILWKKSYLPSLLITALFLPFLVIPFKLSPLPIIVLGITYAALLEYFIGFTQNERKKIISFVINHEKF